jgi:hypothetical protein
MAGSTLSLCTLVLTPLAFIKPELTMPLTALGTALAGLAGANYVTNRMTTRLMSREDIIENVRRGNYAE